MANEWLGTRAEDVDGEALLRGVLALAEQSRVERETHSAEDFLSRSYDRVPQGWQFENAARAISFDLGRAKFQKYLDDEPSRLMWSMVERTLKAKIVRALLEIERDPELLAERYKDDGRFRPSAARFNFVLAAVCDVLLLAFSTEEAEATAQAVRVLTGSDCEVDTVLNAAISVLTSLNHGFGSFQAVDAVVIARAAEGVTLRFNKSQYLPD